MRKPHSENPALPFFKGARRVFWDRSLPFLDEAPVSIIGLSLDDRSVQPWAGRGVPARLQKFGESRALERDSRKWMPVAVAVTL